MTLQEVAARIQGEAKDRRKPVLIGIDGLGGSGKTTFADKLKDALQSAHVVNIDDFIVKAKLAEPSWDKGAFDRERLEREVLLPATTGQKVAYQKLIWATNALGEPVTVPKVDYIIVEGTSSCHPSIAKYYDHKIWIDTPIELAKQRGHARDGSNENAQYWDLWSANDLAYQAKYHPEKQADFVVSGI